MNWPLIRGAFGVGLILSGFLPPYHPITVNLLVIVLGVFLLLGGGWAAVRDLYWRR